MALFTVLEPPDGKPDNVAFVPEGYSWAAFLFTVLWAFWHRMWVVAALLFAFLAGLGIAAGLGVLPSPVASVVQFAASLIFGLEARRLQVMALERAGFRPAGLMEASCREAAELAYFAGRAPAVPAAPARPFRPPADDTLGIFGNV